MSYIIQPLVLCNSSLKRSYEAGRGHRLLHEGPFSCTSVRDITQRSSCLMTKNQIHVVLKKRCIVPLVFPLSLSRKSVISDDRGRWAGSERRKQQNIYNKHIVKNITVLLPALNKEISNDVHKVVSQIDATPSSSLRISPQVTQPESEKPCQRVSNADQKVFASVKSVCWRVRNI